MGFGGSRHPGSASVAHHHSHAARRGLCHHHGQRHQDHRHLRRWHHPEKGQAVSARATLPHVSRPRGEVLLASLSSVVGPVPDVLTCSGWTILRENIHLDVLFFPLHELLPSSLVAAVSGIPKSSFNNCMAIVFQPRSAFLHCRLFTSEANGIYKRESNISQPS